MTGTEREQLDRVEAKLDWLQQYLVRHLSSMWDSDPPWPGAK